MDQEIFKIAENLEITIEDREWCCEAINKIHADFNRSSDTHLIKIDLPCFNNSSLYLKDESTHPTGSLKHRLARSLFLYGICNGQINKNTTIVEASSGSTAISEAYFARLIGLPFVAVIPKKTAGEKVAKIEFYGGECKKVEPKNIYSEAEKLARKLKGHYMDQFTFAERATDWRGNNNIAASLFSQMDEEKSPIPDWVVLSAGTGGTSATIGRYIRYCPELFQKTKLCVVDPENSVFYEYYKTGNKKLTTTKSSRIEGIGRPRVEPSFRTEVVDRMMRIPDAASIATIWWLEKLLGRKCGGSTGTNVYGALKIMAELGDDKPSSVITLICDSGERYLNTYYNPEWIKKEKLDVDFYLNQLEDFEKTGQLG